MSGGVDSSVAAYLMQQEGYECMGATMHLYDLSPELCDAQSRTCCSEKDVYDAGKVALRLGMPFEVLDYRDEFKEKIISDFISTYENGGTPNPCIECNRCMKFDKMLSLAREMGAECIVTGHYARIEKDEKTGRYLLKKALDDTKDQSYVLYMLTQEQLEHIRFPLGEMKKTDVRKLAESRNFKNAHKKDSQDICFVPDGDYAGFMEQYTGKSYPPGKFISTEGEVLGEHKGIVRYTIGQRKGLGIASTAPLYVTRINTGDNTVTLSHGDDLFHREIIISDINLISVPEIKGDMRVNAKIRYRQQEQPAVVRQEKDEAGNDILRLVFDEPQRAATKGQSAVLYDGDTVVGGGIIKEVAE
jgi:tRNA-specific 2-thiouridylase